MKLIVYVKNNNNVLPTDFGFGGQSTKDQSIAEDILQYTVACAFTIGQILNTTGEKLMTL